MSEPSTELATIEAAMRTDIDAYHRDDAMQARYLELVSDRDRVPTGRPQAADAWRGNLNDVLEDVPADLVNEWSAQGDLLGALSRWQDVAVGILGCIEDSGVRNDFVFAFEGLPESARAAVMREAAIGVPTFVRAADDQEIGEFNAIHGVPEFLEAWGVLAARRVAIVGERLTRMIGNMTPDAAREFRAWFWAITSTERRAIVWMLSGSGGLR